MHERIHAYREAGELSDTVGELKEVLDRGRDGLHVLPRRDEVGRDRRAGQVLRIRKLAGAEADWATHEEEADDSHEIFVEVLADHLRTIKVSLISQK